MSKLLAIIFGFAIIRLLFSVFKDMAKVMFKMLGILVLIILIICCLV